MSKTTYFYPNKTLKLGGRLLDLSTPRLMGILNVTPDSFYDGSRIDSVNDALQQAEKMLKEGADILDIGGMSSRPGAELITVEEELNRVIPVLSAIRKQFASTPLSIDTLHGKVAVEAINNGANMINDISAGRVDPLVIETALRLHVPYVLMHMQGMPDSMQESPHYENATAEVFDFLLNKSKELTQQGLNEIIIDPGFGFGKTVEHNYELARNFEVFHQFGFPVMAGVSRKSMICKLLKVNPDKALNGTTALHAILLFKGVNILRVHDVKEAREAVEVVRMLKF